MSNLKNILQSREIAIPKDYEVFKNVYKHFRGKQVKEEGDKDKISGDARPLLEKSEEFYLTSSEDGFMQADVLVGVPASWLASDEKEELVSYISEKMMVMVLSSECDTEYRTSSSQSYIRLCPVYFENQLITDQDLKEGTEKFKNFLGNLKANYFTEFFWMPPITKGGQPLIADLSNVFSIALEDLHNLVKAKKVNKVVSLSQDAYFIYLIKTSWFFLRPSPTDTLRNKLDSLTI